MNCCIPFEQYVQDQTFSTPLSKNAGTTADFGRSVALSANNRVLVVGSPLFVNKKTSIVGAVFVYERCNHRTHFRNEKFTLTQKLNPKNNFLEAKFGFSVALSRDGKTICVGSPNNSSNANKGMVYVFRYSLRSGTYVFVQKITVNDAENHSSFGFEISVSGNGNVIVIGEPFYKESQGKVYMYEKTCGNTFSLQNSFDFSNVLTPFYSNIFLLGASIATNEDGRIIAVGHSGSPKGGVSLFCAEIHPKGSKWSFVENIVPPSSTNDNFGSAVKMTLDARYLVINDRLFPTNGKIGSQGALFVYEKKHCAHYENVFTIIPDINEQYESCGTSSNITVSEHACVINYRVELSPLSLLSEGSVIVFEKSASNQNNWVQKSTILSKEDSFFGNYISANENAKTLVGSAPDPTGNSVFTFRTSLCK